MVSRPPVNPTDTPPRDGGDLDWRREASMADEGGWSAALMEMEEPAQSAAARRPGLREPDSRRRDEPTGPRRLWSCLALGAAKAIAKLTAGARRYAARRAHARSHGHQPTSSHRTGTGR